MKRELIAAVWSRANDRCEYCRFPARYAWLPFQIDHVIAEKHGGQTAIENLALSCYYCNTFKGPNIAGIDPKGDPRIAVQLFNPRLESWNDHFYWSGPELKGRTASGRTTVSVLRINEPEAVELRRLLIEIGERL